MSRANNGCPQVGLSRATTACVIACLFKEFQITASFDGLLHTVPGVNSDILKMDNYVMDPNKVGVLYHCFIIR